MQYISTLYGPNLVLMLFAFAELRNRENFNLNCGPCFQLVSKDTDLTDGTDGRYDVEEEEREPARDEGSHYHS